MIGARPANPGLLDPWDDAIALRHHLAQPDAELLVLLGAEAWCNKCKRLKPAFEALCATQLADHVAALWLDLEDHAEFIGGFVPDDLPLLLHWRAGQCVQVALVRSIEPDTGPVLSLLELAQPNDLPDLWREFAGSNPPCV